MNNKSNWKNTIDMSRKTEGRTYRKDENIAYSKPTSFDTCSGSRLNGHPYYESPTDIQNNRKEVEQEIEKLAAIYLPWWHYDKENPDIGVTIAKIFAGQMGGNLNRYYQVLDKYREEFINMMGISLSPAKPAYSAVNLEIAEDTIPGLKLFKGTKFLAGTEDEPLIFESQHHLYLTNARLETIFMTEGKTRSIIPIRGQMKPISYLPGRDTIPSEDEEEGMVRDYFPFPLFQSERKGIEQNVLLICHESVLDIENDSIFLRIEGNEELNRQIEAGSFQLMYYTKEGLLPVEFYSLLEDGITFEIKKEKENEKIAFEQGADLSCLALITEKPVIKNYEISRIGLSSKGISRMADSVSNALIDLPQSNFELFGDTLNLYQECYIGQNSYFDKAGARIRIRFHTSFGENRLTTVQSAPEETLKVIKRKPRNTLVEVFTDVYPEEISIDYFNGIGWKKLETDAPYAGLFSTGWEGEYEISFLCPKDWQDTQVGSYQGKCIRIQLIKSTNCYLRPGIHHYPVITNLSISYAYEDYFMEPDYLMAVVGTQKVNLTDKIKAGLPFAGFSAGKYEKDSLYLGIDRKIESGPVSIYFKMEKELPLYEGIFKYEYSTIKGFKQMKVVDGTKGMGNSGIVMFMPPSDFKEIELEGKKAYWIRITSAGKMNDSTYFPVISDIRLNVVEVANIETREEEDHYLEESSPNMSIPLGVENILDVELWVNEMGQHSRYYMQNMEKEYPDKIRLEYDNTGEITSFFVKWEETANLEYASEARSYLLDRLYGTLHFGDGIHTRIPKVIEDVSFKIKIRCCQGQKGNVDEGMITESIENLMFVNSITNPVKGHGGSNMETVEKALQRGSGLLRSRGRMVSVKDYTEEILNYSDRIEKIKCITGMKATLEPDPAAVNFVLLLKDYRSGSNSFKNIADGIKKQLLEQAELTILEKDLSLIEPVFVELSVDVWVETTQADQGFEIQTLLQETLEEYLEPLKQERSNGWDIGVLPAKNQIGMQLTRVKKDAMIRKIVVTAEYCDHEGRHQVDLDELKATPFMVCCNGTHIVHVMYT